MANNEFYELHINEEKLLTSNVQMFYYSFVFYLLS